ncbi:MAG: TspO/MBR family protein [Verrucomicrobia bacterium]|jgi:tryptophan-rich sensory protein|nr:TspO/MBR family protein [Verrucomicrobiota bacterium]
MQNAVSLAGFLLLVFACAGLGGWFTSLSVNDWYQSLHKPAWNPPAAVFGPVWTVLYVTIAVAGWMVWKTDLPARKNALIAWSVQLVLNVLWSACFFALKNPGLALIEIVALWLSILVTILLFKPLNPKAAWLLVPYLAWVTFATALNAAIWRLN